MRVSAAHQAIFLPDIQESAVVSATLSGWLRKFVGGQFSGSWPMPVRWTVQAVSRASWGVPAGSPVSRRASS